MPGISIGMQGFPLDKSSYIIIDQVIKWSLLQKSLDEKGDKKNSLEFIRLMSWSSEEVDVYKKEFKKIKNKYEKEMAKQDESQR